MNTKEIPVYMMTGFLDSGKTTFTKDLLTSPDFCSGERTLFLRCEDGEEEYDEKQFAPFNVQMVTFDEQEEFTKARLKELTKQYRPEQVIIEYNGMWPFSLCDEAFPNSWTLYQLVCLIDAKTFEPYSKNLGQMMMEKLVNADVIVFNRCTPELKDYLRSRNLKMVNRQAEIYLEDDEGEGEDYFLGGECPFDLDGVDCLELDERDYGVWYVDCMDYPEHYEGKSVKYKGIIVQSRDFPKGTCAIGRFAMVCCSNDMQFLGMVTKGPGYDKFETKQWVEVTAKVEIAYQEAFHEEGPNLYIEKIVACDPPENEIVGF